MADFPSMEAVTVPDTKLPERLNVQVKPDSDVIEAPPSDIDQSTLVALALLGVSFAVTTPSDEILKLIPVTGI